MRIAHFIGTNFVGGPERQILNHVSRLSPDDHAVLIISFDETGGRELQSAAAAIGVEGRLLPAGRWALGTVWNQLKRLCDDWQPDVICAHGYKAGFYTLLLKMARGARFIGFSRGWTSESLTIHLYSMIDRLVIRFADVIVAVSRSQRDKLLRSWVPDKKIRVVENAVTISVSAATAGPDNDLRIELDLPADARLLLAAGRLSPEKGYDDLIRCFEVVAARVADVHLLIAGAGSLESELRELAATMKSASRIHFLGFRRDMHNLFRQVDMFVLSSLSEGLPNVILEAMAFRVPVVATRVGGLPEVIDDGRTGVLVPPQAPAALAEAIWGVLNNPGLARQLAESAYDDVYNRFSPDTQTNQLLAVYREAMNR